MDLIALAYYATVCACLGWAAPRLGGRMARLGIGALVGLGAAAMLPLLKGLVGTAY